MTDTPVAAPAADASAGELVAASGAAGGLVVHLGSGTPKEYAQMTAALKTDERFVVHGLYHGPADLEDVRSAPPPAGATRIGDGRTLTRPLACRTPTGW